MTNVASVVFIQNNVRRLLLDSAYGYFEQTDMQTKLEDLTEDSVFYLCYCYEGFVLI